MSKPGSSSNEGPRFSFAWFTGTDREILERTPSERRFYDSLGVAVFGISILSGVGLTITASYALGRPVLQMAWLGLAWTALMVCGIEPLVLQVAVNRRRWLPLVVAPRLFFSLMLTVQIGEPLIMKINEDGITRQLVSTNASAARAAQAENRTFFEQAILKDRRQINGIKLKQRRLRANVRRFSFLATCQAGTPACTKSSERGCGPLCKRYQSLAEENQRRLDAALRVDPGRVERLERDGARQARRRDQLEQTSTDAIEDDDGLPARRRAMARLMDEDPSIKSEVWFLRLFLLAIDMTPMFVKVIRAATLRSPYEEMASAFRESDISDAEVMRAEAQLRAAHAMEKLDAEAAVAAETVRAAALGRINEMWRRFRGERVERRGAHRG